MSGPESGVRLNTPVVPCPACGQPVRFEPAQRWRPFCSERCRAADLGAWATERFRIAAQPSSDEDESPQA